MSTRTRITKTGLKLECEVSARPLPRPKQVYPIPAIPTVGAALLDVTLEEVSTTRRKAILITSRGASLPGSPTAAWTLMHAFHQGAAPDPLLWEEIPVTGPQVSVRLAAPLPSATHHFALRRNDAGQIVTFPEATIETPVDPIDLILDGVLSDGILARSEKPGFISRFATATQEKDLLVGLAQTAGISSKMLVATFTALDAYLWSLSPGWDDLTQDTPVDSEQFWGTWQAFDTEKTRLSTTLSGVQKRVSVIALANVALPNAASAAFDGATQTTGALVMLAAQTNPAENAVYTLAVIAGGGSASPVPPTECAKTTTLGTLTNPALAYDGNDATFSSADSDIYLETLVFRGFSGSQTSGNLRIKADFDFINGDVATAKARVYYSLDSGANWTLIEEVFADGAKDYSIALTNVVLGSFQVRMDLVGAKRRVNNFDEFPSTWYFDYANATANIREVYFDGGGTGGSTVYQLVKRSEVLDGELYEVATGSTYGGKAVSVAKATDGTLTLTEAGVALQTTIERLDAQFYKSSDSTPGMNATRTFYAASSSGGAVNVLNTITIKDGLITAWSQA